VATRQPDLPGCSASPAWRPGRLRHGVTGGSWIPLQYERCLPTASDQTSSRPKPASVRSDADTTSASQELLRGQVAVVALSPSAPVFDVLGPAGPGVLTTSTPQPRGVLLGLSWHGARHPHSRVAPYRESVSVNMYATGIRALLRQRAPSPSSYGVCDVTVDPSWEW